MSAHPTSLPGADELVEHLRRTLAARGGDATEVLVHERTEPAQPPAYGVLRPRLPPALGRALLAGGVRQLYRHQVAAIESVRAGRNVVLASPTASGKSLAFALPTLERLLDDPRRRALYLYPTKALIADQLRALRVLLAPLPPELAPHVAVLTGDTPYPVRERLLADPPAILLANPDILHHSLLPGHRRWRRFLDGLDVLVLDELHSYRGVFGAHVALVLRRLRRLVPRTPLVLAASATIGNAVELAEAVVGLPFGLIEGDAAGSGPRRFLLWRPPLRGDPDANEHESALAEASAIFAEALRAGRTGILFGRTRQSVERMLLDVRRLAGPELAERVSAYKSGYRADERARIEADLRRGHLRGVVSTNALELGIDVGALDVAVLAGYPGSVMSFWQQAGRVGRRADREAVVVFVAGDDALDQYHVSHPESFFGQAMEQAVVDPANASIQLGHLLCAAQERPLTEADLELFPSNASSLVARLAGAGELTAGPPWRALEASAHAQVALRGTTREPYTLQTPRGSLGTVEPPYLQRECYPGALYLHNGRGYRVLGHEDAARVVRLVEAPAAQRTSPLLEVEVAPRGEPLASRELALVAAPVRATVGPLVVREAVVGYREHRRGEALTHALDRPLATTLETVGLWLDLPEVLEPDRPAVHAFEHGLVNALPLALLCDRRDLSSSSQPAPGTPGELVRRVYVYDFVEGGIGLAEKGFHLLEGVLERARSLLRECPCTDGCPNCVHLAGCAVANADLDKVGGLALLEGRAVGPARGAAHLLRPHARPAPRASRERRQRLREIAEADLRERFVQPADRPAWLEVGGLAELADLGVVVVWSIEGLRAEVQPLQGGLLRWVPISRLRQPG